MKCPQGQFHVHLYPQSTDKSLRAWDAADEYLLTHIQEQHLLCKARQVFLLNDRQGAITTAVAASRDWISSSLIFVSDSHIATQATRKNLLSNSIDDKKLTWCSSLEIPPHNPDLVILKVPHSLALLEDQLHRLKPLVRPDTHFLAAGMSKTIHTSTLDLFTRIIGPTTTSLARKKARLIFTASDPAIPATPSPYPLEITVEKPALTLSNHAGVFSLRKLDIGSRFLLDHLPAPDPGRRVLDLACGNGLLGISYAQQNPDSEMVFCDESYRAVASAETNFRKSLGENHSAEFLVDDCLENYDSAPFDLILNNPPFHQQRVVSDEVAWKMFLHSRQHLRQGGRLRVVGNRHLAYHAKLKKLFGNVKTIASNRKFVVLDAIRNM